MGHASRGRLFHHTTIFGKHKIDIVSIQSSPQATSKHESVDVAETAVYPSAPPHLVIDNLVKTPPYRGYIRSDSYKRAFDLTTLIFFHITLLPIWLILWSLIPLAIWLTDRGPVFYRQKRLGKNGRGFTLVKFRTMIQDAERDTGIVWASWNDPRITPVGKVLRKLHLDEIPQVINILRGEMSFVGPRPERPELHHHFIKKMPNFHSRMRVLPGLTGLAQLRGCYHSTPRNKVRYDHLYAEHFGPMLDLKLLLLTPIVVIFRKNTPPPPPAKTAYQANTQKLT